MINLFANLLFPLEGRGGGGEGGGGGGNNPKMFCVSLQLLQDFIVL